MGEEEYELVIQELELMKNNGEISMEEFETAVLEAQGEQLAKHPKRSVKSRRKRSKKSRNREKIRKTQ